MNIGAIIIDDDPKAVDVLAKLLTENFGHISILGTSNSVDEGAKLINTLCPQVVFLDIVMPEKNGFKLLEQIQQRDFEVIFCTGYDHYAIKAIRFAALDYLIKPVDITELEEALQKVERRFYFNKQDHRLSYFMGNNDNNNTSEHHLALPTMEGYEYIKLKDIIRCEANSNYTTFHLVGDKKILVSKHLKEFEDLLQGFNFFRVHHSSLVNIEHVKKYIKGRGGQVVMIDKSVLDVSQRKKEAFLEKLNQI